MAVKLKQRRYAEYDLNTLQTDVSQAVQELSSADQPVIRVLQSSQDTVLSGSEDYVLVDMASAVKDVYILLPAPVSLERAVTIKVTSPGKQRLYLKGSDTGSVTINGKAQIEVTDSAKVIATPTQFYTV
jgi:hypothetical protein